MAESWSSRCAEWKEELIILLSVLGTIGVARVAPLVVRLFEGFRCRQKEKQQAQLLERWCSTPRDLVILHTIPRGKTAPNLSPFVTKLETFLKMAKIDYDMDFTMPWAPKTKKTPWITINGEHIGDSQIIIERLKNHFFQEPSTLPGGSYSEEDKAVGRAVRIMMEEHFYWGLGLWRYVYSEGQELPSLFALPPSELNKFYDSARARVKNAAHWQGIGRHDMFTVFQMMNADLLTASRILGGKKYLLGDEPCEEDCSLFGFLTQVLYCAPTSPYKSYVQEKLGNLEKYCDRMKKRYWPEWEQLLQND